MQYLKLVVWGYLAIWILMLIHWIRCKSFYPILNNHFLTKVWWGLTFLLFNPLMTLLYVVFGVFLRPTGHKPKHLLRSRIIVFGMSAVIVTFLELHLTKPSDHIVTARKGDPVQQSSIGFKTTTCESQINTSATSSKAVPANALLDIRRIAILNDSDHPLMIKTAHLLQQALIGLPMVDEVVYYPAGSAPEPGTLLPSYYLRLDMPSYAQSIRPAGRAVEAVITCSGNAFGGVDHLDFPYNFHIPLVDLSQNITVNYKGVISGIESGSAVHDDEAKAIGKSICDQLLKPLTKTADENGLLPRMPDAFYGKYAPAPTMPFEANREVISKLSGCGFLFHNMTIWSYRDERPMHEAMQAVQNALEKEGWNGSDDYLDSSYPTPLELNHDGEHLLLIRQTKPPSTGMYERKESDVMTACYFRPFNEDEILQAAESLLNTKSTAVELLLAFSQQYLNRPNTDDFRKRYENHLIEAKPCSVRACMEMARIWKSRDDQVRAIDMLARAVAMDRLLQNQNDNQQNLNKLGKDLGVDKLEDLPLTDSVLQSIGLIPIALQSTNITRTVALNESFGFYEYGGDDREADSGNSLRTCVFRVFEEATSGPTTGFSADDPRAHWRLSMTNQREFGKSWTARPGQLENGRWTARDEGWARQLSPNLELSVTARETDDGRICFSAVIGN